jgi:hypothetical protein
MSCSGLREATVNETHDFVLGECAAEADLTQFNDVEVLRNFRRDVRSAGRGSCSRHSYAARKLKHIFFTKTGLYHRPVSGAKRHRRTVDLASAMTVEIK